ncbi:MAG: AEC family transporter [Christensenellales bacterium]|jgi:predicted permease
MQNVIEVVITFLALMITGFLLAKFDILDEKTSRKLTMIVLRVIVPSAMLNNIFSHFTVESLAEAGWSLLAPILIVVASNVAAQLCAMLFKVPKDKRGVFCAVFAMCNTIFVGLPVNQALFGEASSMPALFFFMGNTIVFWTYSVWRIRRDGGSRGRLFSMESLKNLLSPSLVMLVACLALLFLRVKPPHVLISTARTLGSPGTPLAMIITGGTIYRGIAHGAWKNKQAIPAMLGRLIISPLAALLVTGAMGVGFEMQRAYVTQAAMPVMSQVTIVAQAYGADDELASSCTLLSMIALLGVVPLLALIFT